MFKTVDFNRRLSDAEFHYFRCTNCAVIFLDPIPDDLARYYPQDYYPIPQSLADLLPEVDAQRARLAKVTEFVKSGHLLEIGPAYGAFAYAAKQAGFSVQTIEMDEHCCHFLAEVVEVDVLKSDDPAQEIPQLGQFDAVVLWQVIEHLENPWLVLDRIAEHILPEGVLALSAPNPTALQFKLMRGHWPHIDAPRHSELIPIPTLAQYMEKRGFSLCSVSTSDAESQGWNSFGWTMAFHQVVRSRTLASFLGKVWSRLIAPIERTGWRGTTYTLVFQRNER
jgi:SAM-dependent methyltransferase